MTFNSPIGLIFHQTHDNPLGELPHEALIFEKFSGNSVVLSKTRSYRPFGGFRDGHTRRSYVSPMEDRSPKDLNGPKIPHWPSPIFVYDPMSVNDGWSGLAQAFWMKSLFFFFIAAQRGFVRLVIMRLEKHLSYWSLMTVRKSFQKARTGYFLSL